MPETILRTFAERVLRAQGLSVKQAEFQTFPLLRLLGQVGLLS